MHIACVETDIVAQVGMCETKFFSQLVELSTNFLKTWMRLRTRGP